MRVEAYGTVDETNAHVGVLRAQLPAEHNAQIMLEHIQHDLFDIGGALCHHRPEKPWWMRCIGSLERLK